MIKASHANDGQVSFFIATLVYGNHKGWLEQLLVKKKKNEFNKFKSNIIALPGSLVNK